MKILLVGYGKMNQLIDSILRVDNHNETVVVDPNFSAQSQGSNQNCHCEDQRDAAISGCLTDLSNETIKTIDAAIDFTTPNAVLGNIDFYIKHKIPAVIGTTGWLDSLDKVQEQATNNNTKLIYASNFSIGVNLFFKLAKTAGQLFNGLDDYDTAITEIHHNKKLDNPSGTGLTIKSEVEQTLGHSVPITGIRVGNVPGTHTIVFDSPEDTIELTHTARNRNGFAKGAIKAAEYITNNNFVGVKDFSEIL
jgi:4-hydroxy-tetrahydrodipicolinate reductase